MINNKKNLFVLCLLVCLFVCSAFGLSCKSAETKPVELKDFNDSTVYAEYKADFSINPYLTAIDNYGGNVVELFSNRFKITSIENYSATISVNLNDKTYTKKLTIEVLDKTAPIITLAEIKAIKGVECEPEINVSKVKKEDIKPSFRVYEISGEVLKELTVTDGKFTPESRGRHKIVITAKDKYGTIAKIEQEFFVISADDVNGCVLEDFSDSSSAVNLRDGAKGAATAKNATWLASKVDKDGTEKIGVVQISIAKGGILCFNSLISKEEMSATDWDYLSIWILVERETLTAGGSGSVYQWNNCNKTYKNKVWTEIRYTKEEINSKSTVWGVKADAGESETGVDCFYKRHSENGTGQYLFSVPQSVTDFTIYIDSIALCKNA